jgi:hypothetical protein
MVKSMLETKESMIRVKKALLFGLLSLFGLTIGLVTNIVIDTLFF